MAKKLLLLALFIGVLYVGATYLSTGHLPWVTLSPEQVRLEEMGQDLERIRAQWAAASRAGSFGMDTGSTADQPLAQLDRLEKALADLTPKLKTDETRAKAASLLREVKTFRSQMR